MLEFFLVVAGLVQVVEEESAHFVDGNGGVDRTGETEPADKVREGSNVEGVRVGQQHRVDFVRKSFQLPEIDEIKTILRFMNVKV